MHEAQLALYDELTTVSGINPRSSILVSSAIHNTWYQTSHANSTKKYVQPSLLLCKYVQSVRRPTAGPANQVLWEAKQVWQNMLLLYALESSCV